MPGTKALCSAGGSGSRAAVLRLLTELCPGVLLGKRNNLGTIIFYRLQDSNV